MALRGTGRIYLVRRRDDADLVGRRLDDGRSNGWRPTASTVWDQLTQLP